MIIIHTSHLPGAIVWSSRPAPAGRPATSGFALFDIHSIKGFSISHSGIFLRPRKHSVTYLKLLFTLRKLFHFPPLSPEAGLCLDDSTSLEDNYLETEKLENGGAP